MIVLGITGSIGMGKSTCGVMLEHLGVPVHDADAEVHTLLSLKGKARHELARALPYYQHPEIYGKKAKGGVRPFNRKTLGKLVFENAGKREILESVLHPHVHAAQYEFIKKNQNIGVDVVALDIPLLFETGADRRVDYVINVTAPFFLQSQRVLSRPNMTADKFKSILERQTPDGEKNIRADYVLHTGLGRAYTMRALKKILAHIKKREKIGIITAKPQGKKIREKKRFKAARRTG